MTPGGSTRRDEGTTRRDDGLAADGRPTDDWPVDLRGVTESIVATAGPNGLYNQAALGLTAGPPVTARTWGRTRTWRNFREREERFDSGVYVQFSPDPIAFVEAALGVYETDEPILAGTAAWVRVEIEEIDAGRSGGTEWWEWRLKPVEGTIRERTVPTTNRGYYAVIEATVAASRLDVDAYEESVLLDRLSEFASVVDTCGGDAEQAAFDRLSTLVPWRDRLEE